MKRVPFGQTTVVPIAALNYSDKDGYTPLVLAIDWYGNTESIVALINAGADLNIEYFADSSALHHAIYYEYDIEVIEAILKRGVALDFEVDELTPIEYARENLNSELDALLLKYSG